MDASTYMPILLTKRGERAALRDLPPLAKSRLQPMFVVPPVPWDFDEETPAKTTEQHVFRLSQEIVSTWGTGAACLDLRHIDDGSTMSNGAHPLAWLGNQARIRGLVLRPVVAPARTASYIAAAREMVQTDQAGVCLRLGVSEWPSGEGQTHIEALLEALSVAPDVTDLVLDLGADPAAAGELALQAVRTELRGASAEWRSIVVAGTAFPRDLSAVGRGLSLLERTEWLNYRSLRLLDETKSAPRFADYGIANPDPGGDVDPRLMSLSAHLRYTQTDAWVISKGQLFRGRGGSGQGGAAMAAVAEALVVSDYFMGATHCSGCLWISQVAEGASGGNPEVWRRVGTTHHLTLVGESLAKLSAS
jgi:hypothetical protein